MLLSQLALSVSGFILGMQDLSYDNEANLAATSLAQSVLREVAAKNFDELTINKKVVSTDSLTTVASLGPDLGETYPAFDDLDDFNGHTRTIATDRLGDFTVNVTVNYTTSALLGAPSGTRTFLKAAIVTIYGNPYLAQNQNVVMNTIVSY